MNSSNRRMVWVMHGVHRVGFQMPTAGRMLEDDIETGPDGSAALTQVTEAHQAWVIGSGEDSWANLLLAIPDAVDSTGAYRNGPAWEGAASTLGV